MHRSVSNNNTAVSLYLLIKGAKVMQPNCDGETAWDLFKRSPLKKMAKDYLRQKYPALGPPWATCLIQLDGPLQEVANGEKNWLGRLYTVSKNANDNPTRVIRKVIVPEGVLALFSALHGAPYQGMWLSSSEPFETRSGNSFIYTTKGIERPGINWALVE